jgi:hypothetical protein
MRSGAMSWAIASNRRALAVLGQERFRAFLQAANAAGGRCIAVDLFCERLAAGATPDEVLLDPRESYSLSVRRTDERRFTIAFSCVPGPLVGDGGE